MVETYPHVRDSQEKRNKDSFLEYAAFIREQYPGDGQRMIREALDGFEVLDEHGRNGELIGILTYQLGHDRSKREHYCAVGLILVSEDSRGEGIASGLFRKLRSVCDTNISYYTAKADTEDGEALLENLGFESDGEDEGGKPCFRLDVDT